MSELKYRILCKSDIPAFRSLAGESLLVQQDDLWDRFIDRIGLPNLRGMFDASRLVATSGYYPMGQWFGGKSVSCAGISVVSVDITRRGQGVCGGMLRHLLRELREKGFALASLFASTEVPYRAVGFEQAGVNTKYRIPLECLGNVSSDLPVTRYEDPPLETLIQVANQRAARTNGNLDRNSALWQRALLPFQVKKTYTYVFGSAESPQGYAIVYARSRDQDDYSTLIASDVVVNTPDATRRLIQFLNDHRSVTTAFQWPGPPDDDILAFASEGRYEVISQERSLNRILHLPDSLSARGYAKQLNGELHFEVNDPLLTENSGRWIVQLHKGEATVQRGGDGFIRTDINALAPLYSGMYSASRLQHMGWIHCDQPDQLNFANQTFAGPPPWMPEMF